MIQSRRDSRGKHYHGFVTIAEEQSRQLRKSQVSSEEIQEKAVEGMASCMVTASHVIMVGIMSEMDEEDACLIVDQSKPRKNVFAPDEGIYL